MIIIIYISQPCLQALHKGRYKNTHSTRKLTKIRVKTISILNPLISILCIQQGHQSFNYFLISSTLITSQDYQSITLITDNCRNCKSWYCYHIRGCTMDTWFTDAVYQSIMFMQICRSDKYLHNVLTNVTLWWKPSKFLHMELNFIN